MGILDDLAQMEAVIGRLVGLSREQAAIDREQVAIDREAVEVRREAATILPAANSGTGPRAATVPRLVPISTGGGGEGGGNSRIATGGQGAPSATTRSTGGGGEGGNSRIPTTGQQLDPGAQQVTRAIGGLRVDVVRGNDAVAGGLARLARSIERQGVVDLRGEGLL